MKQKSKRNMPDDTHYETKFWGLQCEPGKKYPQNVDSKLYVTMAALDPFCTDKGITQNPYVTVLAEQGKEKYLLCTLKHKNLFHVNLNLVFDVGEAVTFCVQGTGKVCLTGYRVIIPENEENTLSKEENRTESKPNKSELSKLTKEYFKEDKEVAHKELPLWRKYLTEENIDDQDSSDEDFKISMVDVESDEEYMSEDELLVEAEKELGDLEEEGEEEDDEDEEDEEEGENDADEDEEEEENDEDEEEEEEEEENDENEDNEEEDEVEKVKNKQKPFKNKASSKRKSEMVSVVQKRLKQDFVQQSDKKAVKKNPVSNVQKKKKKKKNSLSNSAGPENGSSNEAGNAVSDAEDFEEKILPKKSLDNSMNEIPKKKKLTSEVVSTSKKDPNKHFSGRLEGGVEYDDIKIGHGPVATKGKILHVYYIGRLPNRQIFDAITAPRKPFSFKLGSNEVLRGWEIGVRGMQVGGKRNLRIPPEMGYGKAHIEGIPPNSTLYFTVELIGVQ